MPCRVPRPLPEAAPWRPGAAWTGAVIALALLAPACGRRGAPLPPLPRIPAAVETFSAVRRGDVVDLSLVVPSANAGGDTPGDIAAVEVYAVTAITPPRLESGVVPPGLVRVASSPVRRPLPPPPPDDEKAARAPMPAAPGLDQGATAAFREVLSAEATRAVEVPAPAAAAVPGALPDTARPLVFVDEGQRLKRHYVAVAVSRRGRRGAWSSVRSVPVAPPSGAPSAPAIAYDATAYTLTWTPAPDARVAAPTADGVLESRPLEPQPPATRYLVYETDPAGVATGEPVTAEPVATPTATVSGVSFGRARCFVVRGVDTLDGVTVEGPASAPACAEARDTFAPPAPTALEAVGGAGVISLIWEGVEAADLAGYLVLRGVAGGEPVTLLTPEPIPARSFEDRTVTAGTRYVYVVVAVDSATPANRSAPSNRAEETARQ